MELFLVGGAVRDTFLARKSKDWDFTVTGVDSFASMRAELESDGFEVFTESPEHLTVRARAPKGWTFGNFVPPVRTFDFVMARKDIATDGRRATVAPGSLLDDLRRRDFTMNAIAMTGEGKFIDPFDGKRDIERRTVRAVGTPEERMREDGLRVLRAVRFAVTLGFGFDGQTRRVLRPEFITDAVSDEKIREELLTACRADWLSTFRWLDRLGLLARIQQSDVWFKPTMESR